MRIILALLFILIVASSCSERKVVDLGEAGVIVNKETDKAQDTVLEQGVHSIPYWGELVVFNVRPRNYSYELDLLSSDGYDVQIEGIYRYSLVKKELPELYNEIGKNYHDHVVIPALRAAFREAIGSRKLSSIDPSSLDTLRNRVEDSLTASVRRAHIRTKALLIKGYEKPDPEERRVVIGGYKNGVAYKMTYRGDRSKENAVWSFLISDPSLGEPDKEKVPLERTVKGGLIDEIAEVVEDTSVIISLRDAVRKNDLEVDSGNRVKVLTHNKAHKRIEFEARRSGPHFISISLLHTDTSFKSSPSKIP